jgi:hypothetical protein
MLVGFLVLIGIVSALLLVAAADRLLKARARGRRLRVMSDRLDAATARMTTEHQQRQDRDQASQALTSYIPAIQRPPQELPDFPRAAGTRRGRLDRAARRDHDARRAARREHPGRPARAGTQPGSRAPGTTSPDS